MMSIPRGVEVLIKKAAVDPAFKKMLLEKRAGAAEAISLTLEPAEAAMLEAVPEAQLRAIVANTKVCPGLRPAFLGCFAAAMLAALAAAGCKEPARNDTPYPVPPTGISPDIPESAESAGTAETAAAEEESETAATSENEPKYGSGLGTGIRPDKP